MIERFGELPDDVDQLKALALEALARADRSEIDAEAFRSQTLNLTAKVEDLTQTNAAANAEIDRLTSIIKTLRRDRFGKRSEKLGDDEAKQQSFVFEEVETGLAAIAARLAAKAETKPRKATADKPRFPSHLERVEVILEPEVPPEFEGKERVKIGQEESVRLDVVRARFRLIVTIRPKYIYKELAAILQAPAPEHIVEAGLPTEALLAQVAVSKYADGLPLYRQEAIYGRGGVELSRSLMAQWMGSVGLLAAHVLARIREGERIFADETTLPTLNPGAGKTKTAWLWAYARDDRPFGGAGPPMVAYRYEDSRAGDCAVRHLGDYRGILQCDGYAGYRKLAGAPHSNGLRLAGCWAHLWMPPLLQGLDLRFRKNSRLLSSIRPVMATRPASPALMVNPQAKTQSRATSSRLGAPSGFARLRFARFRHHTLKDPRIRAGFWIGRCLKKAAAPYYAANRCGTP